MKRFIKIFFISVASLLGILVVVVSITLWLVFTPEKLTPIIRKQAAKYITCKANIGETELTFFSTFPHFGIKIDNFSLINPITGSPSDTLVNVNQLVGVIDVNAWIKDKKILLTGLNFTNGSISIFSDSVGHTNYDIMVPDTTSSITNESETTIPTIDLRDVKLDDIDLQYDDLSLKLNTIIHDLTAEISGIIGQDNINGRLKTDWSWILLEYEGEKYIQQASVKCNTQIDFTPSKEIVRLKNTTASINGLEFSVEGAIQNDTINDNIDTDLSYKLKSWPVKNMLTLVPPSFGSYFKGIEADGIISSDGSIKGIMNDSVMPMMNIHLMLEDGKLKYEGFPLQLHDVSGDINVCSDMATDSVSFLRINSFSAKTPLSTFKTKGVINHLFSDIYCDLTTSAGLTLDEFNQMIPSEMKIKMKGKVAGEVKSAFSMSQIEKMQIQKMKLSGSVTLSDFDTEYDSLSIKTDHSKIDFSLPNRKSSTGNTKFLYANILSDNMEAGKLESYNAFLKNASIILETSDIRDSTRIPDFNCSFNIDHLKAGMDTMSIEVDKPHGNISLSPRPGNPVQPKIKLFYNSERLIAAMGHSTAAVNKINIDTDILNDNTQKDIFLQWLVNGVLDIDNGTINISGLSYPIEIPSIKMNLDNETFNIKESKIKIDKSDFQLTGNLNNVLSYFRGDSILRGKFNFVSNTTDVSQLMALTSGIGNVDSTAAKQTGKSSGDSTYAGPYMVPKGIDVSLNTNIKTATFGIDTATNINGDVQVHDGILLLDGLTFTTPAAKMQLTAMYRTPRKNHLFLGIDYHMLDVEIGELLTMIPDIDSLMPMLRSFGGKGEFHIAAETYLDSLYNLKKSTLRGAASIKGNDLVLMDGETFSEIAKMLNFNKKTVNRVDSLSAEFTIFRNEIDVYPFLLVMDKYKAVVAGRHNFDLSFSYNISIVDCPLPIKLGLDISGNMDNLKYRLAKCKYAEFYRPSSRKVVENKQLELRKMIREALTQKVKEE